MGKVVGGSGRLNYLLYIRGHKHDFDKWYENKKDYDFEKDVLWYFKKSENQNGIYAQDGKYHSSGGPLYASDVPYLTILSQRILKGALEIGYPTVDLNKMTEKGFMEPQINLKNGQRWTTGHSFMLKLNTHKNVHLLTNAQVSRVLFYKEFEAKAVEFLYNNKKYKVKAKKEIILSSGVVKTPTILMQSGIGIKKHLEQFKIKAWNHLPVGNNLMDHVTTGIDLIEINTTLNLDVPALLSPISIWDYYINARGPWTTAGCEIVGMIGNNKIPELGFMVIPIGVTTDRGKR